MKNNPINIKREDHCIYCHSDRVVELYDAYNKPVNYSYFLDNQDKIGVSTFDKREMSYFKCRKCGQSYNIEWHNGKPEPSINKNTLFIFLNNVFKKRK